MRDLGKVITHIPARAGSKRVPSKNLRYLGGQPLLAYTVKAALACNTFNSVYVNTDSLKIAALAEQLGAKVYHRRKELASDTTTSDQFNIDIIESLNPDTLIMINPVCPLIEASDIENAIEIYQRNNIDTLISSDAIQMQCFYLGQPVNIDLDMQLAPSQDNEPVHVCNWAVTVWDAHKFKYHYYRDGYAVFGENRILLPIDPSKSYKISTEEDFKLIELMINSVQSKNEKEYQKKYWSTDE